MHGNLYPCDRDVLLRIYFDQIITFANSGPKLVDPVHIQTSGVKPPEQGQRHIYDVPASAVSEGYNLVEVIAEQDVEITWVEIAVR